MSKARTAHMRNRRSIYRKGHLLHIRWYVSSQGNECEFSCQEIKHAAEDERDERTAHDDHVVGHAEVWGGEVHEKGRRVDPAKPVFCGVGGAIEAGVRRVMTTGTERNQDSRRQVPASLCIRRVLRVPQERFDDVHSEHSLALRRKSKYCLKRCGACVRHWRDVVNADDIVVCFAWVRFDGMGSNLTNRPAGTPSHHTFNEDR